MAFVTINSASIEVGDPVTADLVTTIKDNLDDLDSRVTTIAAGQTKIELVNDDFIIGINPAASANMFIEVIQNCIVTEGAIQIFAKSPATTGSLTVDIKVNTSTNPTGFNSLFSTLPTLNIATCANYQRQTGVLNATYQTLAVGDILRVDVTSLPAKLEKFRVNLIAELV